LITFITTFKPFKPPFDTIQLNALKSWLRFCPPCEIVVIGAEEGVKEAVDHMPYVTMIPSVKRSAFGAPLLDDFIRTGESVAKHELICLVNGDIIIADDILKVVKTVKKRFNNRFLLTCRRYDTTIKELINDTWYEKIKSIREQAIKAYLGRKPRGADLFVFGKGLFDEIPPFAIGRLVWSRWLIYKGLSMGIPVIDATEALTVIHQQHDYAHITESSVQSAFLKGKAGYDAVVLGQDYKHNLTLGGVGAYFSEDDCNYILTRHGLGRRTDIRFSLRKLIMTPLLNPSTRRHAILLTKILFPSKILRRSIKKSLFKMRILY
jgi:hypothetical protein